jgi:hypothetical protein
MAIFMPDSRLKAVTYETKVKQKLVFINLNKALYSDTTFYVVMYVQYPELSKQ